MSVIEQLLRQQGYNTIPSSPQQAQRDALPFLLYQERQVQQQLLEVLKQQQTTMDVFNAQLYCAQVQQALVRQLVVERAPQRLLVINPQPAVTQALLAGLDGPIITLVDDSFQKLPGSSTEPILQYDMVLCFDTELFWQSHQKSFELMAFMRQSLSHSNKNALVACFFRDAHRVLTAYYQTWPQSYRALRTQQHQQQFDHRLKKPALNDPRFSMQEILQLNADPYSLHWEKLPLLFTETLQQQAHHYGMKSVKQLAAACLEQQDTERSCKHFSTRCWQQKQLPNAGQDQFCRAHTVILLQLQ
jgi:hypothetical protein